MRISMRILMFMKAKYDIYIRKDLQDMLNKEPNMSGLINELLAEHFMKVEGKREDFATVGIRTKKETVRTDDGIATIVTPNKRDVKQFWEKTAETINQHIEAEEGEEFMIPIVDPNYQGLKCVHGNNPMTCPGREEQDGNWVCE